MGLPIPTKVKTIYAYIPWWPTVLFVVTLVGMGLWVHHVSEIRYRTAHMLDILSDGTNADNFSVIVQSTVSTAVLYMILATTMYGVMLWALHDQAKMDIEGEVKDTRNWMLVQALVGLRVGWWLVMTWIVVLMIGCGIVAAYLSNLKFMIRTVLSYQSNTALTPLPANYVPVFPQCPIQCLNLWIVDYIVSPPEYPSCFCDPPTLTEALVHTQAAINAVPGMLVGVFLLYVVGGFWRSELSKVFEHARQCRNFAELIANNAGGGGSGGRRKK